MKNPKLYDVTLRDGNHALRHTLTAEFVKSYCQYADTSDVWAIEVGHGNGLGASSHLVGKSKESDCDLLEAARQHLTSTKLAVHSIPGFATIKRDIKPAIAIGVDIFRIATHVTEADVSQKHIEYLASNDVEVHGVLMMSHMIDLAGLIKQVSLMKKYGARAVILMDSAGYFIPADVLIWPSFLQVVPGFTAAVAVERFNERTKQPIKMVTATRFIPPRISTG